jgi:hypothetical protein
VGEILGLGITHYPPLAGRNEAMAGIFRWTLKDPAIPADLKNPTNWPAAMQAEWGSNEGKDSAPAHRAELLSGFSKVRAALDEFQPDFVVIWGDDQCENFNADIIPAFCVLAYDDIQAQPWKLRAPGMPGAANVWSEIEEQLFMIRGHRKGGKFLATRLLSEGFDVAYAYKPLHLDGFGHAFLNSVAYLDYDRTGFSHPLVCFTVNCYGRRVLAQEGGTSRIGQIPEENFDPPSPSPTRCFELGAAGKNLQE